MKPLPSTIRPALAAPPSSPREFIRSAAEAMMAYTAAINRMEPRQRRALIEECNKLTQTNCWWLEFRIAPLLKKEAEEAVV